MADPATGFAAGDVKAMSKAAIILQTVASYFGVVRRAGVGMAVLAHLLASPRFELVVMGLMLPGIAELPTDSTKGPVAHVPPLLTADRRSASSRAQSALPEAVRAILTFVP